MSVPFPWLRKIKEHIQSYDSIPLYGNAPPFDWTRFATLAAAALGIQQFAIRAHPQGWCGKEELEKGIGKNVLVVPLKAAPLEGSAFWMMSRADVKKLSGWLLQGRSDIKPLASVALTEGFYRFLLLQLLNSANGIGPLQNLSLQLDEESPMPECEAYCIDVEIEFEEKTCWGKLAIEPELQKSWVKHFDTSKWSLSPDALAGELELDLSLKVGSSSLSLAAWKKAKKGDFLLLDKMHYDPRSKEAIGALLLGKTSLFEVKVKYNKIELLGRSAIREEEAITTMNRERMNAPAEMLPEAAGEIAPIKEVPLTVTVELARFRITLEKLLKMAPGNLIELPVHPEQTVFLSVNGQVIGKGELVHLGETVGVRILEN